MFRYPNYYTRYPNSQYRNYFGFNPTFNQAYNNNFFNSPIDSNKSNNEETKKDSEQEKENNESNPANTINHNTNNSRESNENHNKKGFILGNISFDNNELSIFGFNFALDDLIIIGIIILLLLQSECDYTLIIILGLILFNVNFSSLNLF